MDISIITTIWINKTIVKSVQLGCLLKSSILVVPKTAAPKKGVEFYQRSICAIRCSLAMSNNDAQRRKTWQYFRPMRSFGGGWSTLSLVFSNFPSKITYFIITKLIYISHFQNKNVYLIATKWTWISPDHNIGIFLIPAVAKQLNHPENKNTTTV